ncbi:MAG: SRPBCC family protein [Tepidiformaceae bacterium]
MTDAIEKEVNIRAPRSRVWRAIAERSDFGEWFGVDFAGSGEFRPGETVSGNLSAEDWKHLAVTIEVVDVVPETNLSFHWHPYAVDVNIDYSAEPMTVVEFTLEDVAGGTRLRVVESGFDRIPLERRAEAIRMNDGGWAEQIQNIERYVLTSV